MRSGVIANNQSPEHDPMASAAQQLTVSISNTANILTEGLVEKEQFISVRLVRTYAGSAPVPTLHKTSFEISLSVLQVTVDVG